MLERRTGLPVVLWDERLTTVAAEKTLIEANVRREHRKEYVDKILIYKKGLRKILDLTFFIMGRTTGIEPAHGGATIRCVNHFTMCAIFYY